MANSEPTKTTSVDLDHYEQKIESGDDVPLFREAVRAAQAGALRASYIMVWLACAESLKRRFREARVRDHQAGVIVGAFEDMEKQHRAVDKYLLDKAVEYGLVSDSGHAQLLQIYDNRCIYGHPYEEGPSQEKLVGAAATVVDIVLSKPVKLRHGYANRLLDELSNIDVFLDDQESAVANFATNTFLPKIDESLVTWILDRYWERLESIAGEPSMGLFFRRGQWFTRAVVLKAGVEILDPEQWHEKAVTYPRTVMAMAATDGIFELIGQETQNTLVNATLKNATTNAAELDHLMVLYDTCRLLERHRELFEQCVSELPVRALRSCSLDPNLFFDTVIEALKSRSFDTQNMATDLIVSSGPDQINTLADSKLEVLGRSILDAAELNAWQAMEFLRNLENDVASWPLPMLRGVLLESFISDQRRIQLKVRHLRYVLAALDHLDDASRTSLIDPTVSSINAATEKRQMWGVDWTIALAALNEREWAQHLAQQLEQRIQAIA